MRIIFIGTVDFSRQALSKLMDLDADIKGVVTKKASPYNADFSNITELCKNNNIPVYHTQDINHEECVRWIKDRKPDVLFCFGWSQLIKKALLSLAPLGVVGFHPALLPQNRGRHPIIWALALGLEETGSTFFFMDEGADSGDILSQKGVPIEHSDTASTLYQKITTCALKQIEEFLPALIQNDFEKIPQDHRKATYWRKRTSNDGLIDWRMPAKGIYNLVRALSTPYVGAHTRYNTGEHKIWAVSETPGHYPQNTEPGKVIEVDNAANTFTVKCGVGAIIVTEHELVALPKTGDYL
jgi:methionyl-tRNA formyltransferase